MQQLSDCFRATNRAGQFLSEARSADPNRRVGTPLAAPERRLSRRREDDQVVLARVVQKDACALVDHVGIETLVAQLRDAPLPDLSRSLRLGKILDGDL